MSAVDLRSAAERAAESYHDAECKVLGLVMAVVKSRRAPNPYVPIDSLLDLLVEAEDVRTAAFDAMQAARQAVIDAYDAQAGRVAP